MQKTNEIVPWEKSGVSGYASLDLSMSLGSNVGKLEVRRARPDRGADAGNFIAWHNDVRISDRSYAKRAECCAEAEKYLYELPTFKASNTGAAVMAMIEFGRIGYREGKSIYDNPIPPDHSQSRAHWAQGWLETFGAGVAASAINAAAATARANSLLEGDLQMALARTTVHKLAIRYALEGGAGFADFTTDERLHFLTLFLADDANVTVTAFPDWPKFVADQTGAAIQIIPPKDRN